jgi:hypothetical protein
MDTQDRVVVYKPGRMEQEGMKFHHITQNSVHFLSAHCLFLEFSI